MPLILGLYGIALTDRDGPQGGGSIIVVGGAQALDFNFTVNSMYIGLYSVGGM